MGSLLRAFTATLLASQAAAAQSVTPNAIGTTSRNDFRSEAEATRHCRGRPVVWVVASRRVYFVKGDPNYGAEGGGAFMCEDEARADGNRLAGKGTD